GAGATLIDWSLQVEGGNLAMLRFVLDLRGGEVATPELELEARLQSMLRGWAEAVESELAQLMEPGRAAAIATRFAEAFPTAYRTKYGATEAALDIARMRDISAAEAGASGNHPNHRDARLYTLDGDADGHLRLKVY